MAWYWLWVLAVGAILGFAGVVGNRFALRQRERGERPAVVGVGLGVVLAACAFLLCLPSRFPFARGGEMGYGVLLGAGASLLGAIVVWLSGARERQSSYVAVMASLGGIALAWLAVTEIVFPGDPIYGLLGGSAGALLVLLPILFSHRGREQREFEFFGLFVVTLALGAMLAIFGYDKGALRPWWVLCAVAGAATLLGAMASALILGRAQTPRWVLTAATVVVALAFWLGAAMVLRPRYALGPYHHLTALLGIGWVVFGLAEALLAASKGQLAMRLVVPLLAAVLLVLGFNLGHGYGLSLALVGGLAFSLPATDWRAGRGRVSTGLWLGLLGAFFLGYRLFLERFGGEFRGQDRLEFGRHYVFVGLVAGVLWAAAACAARPTRIAAMIQMAALAGLPPILFIVFGYEALLGVLMGLLLSQMMLPFGKGEAPRAAPLSFFALVMLWTLIVPGWSYFLLEVARWVRGLVIGMTVAVVVLGLSLLRERDRAGPAETEGC